MFEANLKNGQGYLLVSGDKEQKTHKLYMTPVIDCGHAHPGCFLAVDEGNVQSVSRTQMQPARC